MAKKLPAVRIYTPAEQKLLSREAQGTLLKLELAGILSSDSREFLLEQLDDDSNTQISNSEFKALLLQTVCLHDLPNSHFMKASVLWLLDETRSKPH